MDLEGRTAVITGASRGLGAGLAVVFRERGMRLARCARGDCVLEGDEAVLTRRVDVAREDEVARFAEEAVAHLGPIDLWVNNAGVLEPIAPLRDCAPDAIRRHVEINLLGVFWGCQAYVRHRRAVGGGGVLLNVSSGAARNAYAGWAAYCAAKAGVDRLTEVIALEEEARGLRCLSVAPGVIDTEMQAQIRARSAEEFPEVERFREMKAQESFNTPRFVAEHLLAMAFDPAADPGEVLARLPDEKA
jgi:NAD(P)-dependent dehydrogenase (short-subunit alcohol dehydrogenase family)